MTRKGKAKENEKEKDTTLDIFDRQFHEEASGFVEKFSSRCSGNRTERPSTSSPSFSRCVNDNPIASSKIQTSVKFFSDPLSSSPPFFHLLLSFLLFLFFFFSFLLTGAASSCYFDFSCVTKEGNSTKRKKDCGVWWGGGSGGRGPKEEGQRERKEGKKERKRDNIELIAKTSRNKRQNSFTIFEAITLKLDIKKKKKIKEIK